MRGWDGYPVGDWLRERYGVPAVIDNDVNIAARGEHQLIWPDVEHLLFVKVATGIGCGIVASGRALPRASRAPPATSATSGSADATT